MSRRSRAGTEGQFREHRDCCAPLIAIGAYVVLLSSTACIDFETPHVAADAPTRPRTFHGEIKADAEKMFLEGGAHGAVLRLTKVLTPDTGEVPAWIDSLRRRESITAFSDLHIAPISLEDATAAMLAVAKDRGASVYQMSGAKDVSYYEIALHLAKGEVSGRPGRTPTRSRDRFASRRYCTLHVARQRAYRTSYGSPAPDPYDVIDSVYTANQIQDLRRREVKVFCDEVSRSLYRKFREQRQRAVVIDDVIRVLPGARIVRSTFNGPINMESISLIDPDFNMGKYTSLNQDTFIIRATIGAFCAIGARSAIYPFNHPTGWFSIHEFQYHPTSYGWAPEYDKMTKRESIRKCSQGNRRQ